MSNYFTDTSLRVVVCKKKDGSWSMQTRDGDKVLAETLIDKRQAKLLVNVAYYRRISES